MNDLALIPDKGQLATMMDYAEQIAACGLFPVKDRAAAFGMVQIAMAEGIAPVKVFEKYHLIPSRTGGVMPCLKSIWVMSEFCQRGGKLRRQFFGGDDVGANRHHPAFELRCHIAGIAIAGDDDVAGSDRSLWRLHQPA